MASGYGGEAGSGADVDGRVPAEEGCPECLTRSTYSLGCIHCCRRLYAEYRDKKAILSHLLQYSPLADQIRSAMRKTKSGGGKGNTGE